MQCTKKYTTSFLVSSNLPSTVLDPSESKAVPDIFTLLFTGFITPSLPSEFLSSEDIDTLRASIISSLLLIFESEDWLSFLGTTLLIINT